jgi:flagellar protein FlbD
MIQLTRLNGNPLVLNSDLIKTAEASPDTMLTLINGEKLIVREKLGDVVQRVLAYLAALLAEVAHRLESSHTLLRAASLSSIELENSPFPQPSGDPVAEDDDQ